MNKTIKFNKHLSKCKDIIMNELEKEILKDVVTELKQNDFCLKSKDIDIVPCAEVIDELLETISLPNKLHNTI